MRPVIHVLGVCLALTSSSLGRWVAEGPKAKAAAATPVSRDPNHPLDPNRPQDPNQQSRPAPISPEDEEIIQNLEFFRLFDLIKSLQLFIETP